jgi:hypothetical protein
MGQFARIASTLPCDVRVVTGVVTEAPDRPGYRSAAAPETAHVSVKLVAGARSGLPRTPAARVQLTDEPPRLSWTCTQPWRSTRQDHAKRLPHIGAVDEE